MSLIDDVKLRIGIPVPNVYGNHTSVMWAIQLIAMRKPKTVHYSVSQLRIIPPARNAIVKTFLESRDEYLLFIDADTVPPIDGLQQLLSHCKDYDIVSGLYFEKTSDRGPVAYDGVHIADDGYPIWHRLPKWDDAIIPVEAVGMGFCLIPRRVFEKVQPPFYRRVYDDAGYVCTSEDLYFCKKVRDAGFTIGLVTSCRCVHVGGNEPISSPRKPSSFVGT